MTSSPRMTAKGSSPTSARHQHRVAEAERLALADVGEVDQVRDLADFLEQVACRAPRERLELHRDVEMILDGVLAAPGHEDDVVDARGDCFLHAVLDDRLVYQRQHLFRLRLGGGEETSTEAGGGKDGFANGWHGRIVTYNAAPAERRGTSPAGAPS